MKTQTHRKKNTNEKEFKWIFERKLQTEGFLRRAEIWDLSRERIYTRVLRIGWRGLGLGSTVTPKGRSEAAATNLHPEWTAPKFPAHQAARPSMHPKCPAEGSRATQAPRRSPGETGDARSRNTHTLTRLPPPHSHLPQGGAACHLPFPRSQVGHGAVLLNNRNGQERTPPQRTLATGGEFYQPVTPFIDNNKLPQLFHISHLMKLYG